MAVCVASHSIFPPASVNSGLANVTQTGGVHGFEFCLVNADGSQFLPPPNVIVACYYAPFGGINVFSPPCFADGSDPGNILIIQENNTGCGDGICDNPDDEGSRFSDRPTGIISFQFAQAIELISLDFFDIETAEDGSTDNNRIRMFDDANNEILANTYYTPDTGGNNLWDQVLFGNPSQGVLDIARIDVYFGGSGALDNLVYKDIPPVPVPSAVWLFGTALIGFVGMSRRRKVA